MSSLVFLIRDSSKLSEKVEGFLVQKKISYDVFYTTKKDNLPLIYYKDGCFPYEGEGGFNVFKDKFEVSEKTQNS
jgi:hypothetical protein